MKNYVITDSAYKNKKCIIYDCTGANRLAIKDSVKKSVRGILVKQQVAVFKYMIMLFPSRLKGWFTLDTVCCGFGNGLVHSILNKFYVH